MNFRSLTSSFSLSYMLFRHKTKRTNALVTRSCDRVFPIREKPGHFYSS